MNHTSNAFLDMLDLGGNLQRAIRGLNDLGGVEALGLAVGLALLDIVCWTFAWRFDFQPTIQATAAFSSQVLPSLPTGILPYASLIGLLITLAPMLAEFVLPRLAAANFRVAALAVYGLSVFDVYTDWPNVAATMEQVRGGFDRFGLLAAPAFWIARILLLAFATHGFELLAIVVGVCALHLLWQSRR
jgi:hypothetical protein